MLLLKLILCHHAVIMPSSSLVHGCYYVAFMSAMKHTTKILNTSSQLESHISVIEKHAVILLASNSSSNKLAAIRNESMHNITNSLIMYNIN